MNSELHIIWPHTKKVKTRMRYGRVKKTYLAEVKSSRTHFEVLGLGLEGQVLGLGLEALSPRKLACPRLEKALFLELLKVCGTPKKFFGKRFFVEIA